MAQFKREPLESICVTEPDEVKKELEALGLEEAILTEAVRYGLSTSKKCNRFHPTYYTGSVQSADTVMRLRQILVGQGWKQADKGGFAKIVSPDGERSIVVASGCDRTGCPGMLPTTKSPKGRYTKQAVLNNRVNQLRLFVVPDDTSILVDGKQKTWYILYHTNSIETRIEISAPKGMDQTKGYINDWEKRIICKPIPQDEKKQKIPAFAETPEVTILRK